MRAAPCAGQKATHATHYSLLFLGFLLFFRGAAFWGQFWPPIWPTPPRTLLFITGGRRLLLVPASVPAFGARFEARSADLGCLLVWSCGSAPGVCCPVLSIDRMCFVHSLTASTPAPRGSQRAYSISLPLGARAPRDVPGRARRGGGGRWRVILCDSACALYVGHPTPDFRSAWRP